MEAHRIDLIALGSTVPVKRSFGNSISTSFETKSIISAVEGVIKDSVQGYVLFLQQGVQLDEKVIYDITHHEQPITVWYDDRVTNSFYVSRVIEYVSPGIYFNLKTSEEGFSIWNMSLQCLLVKKDLLKTVRFLDSRFVSTKGALVEWLYRMLYSGVLIKRERMMINPQFIHNGEMAMEDDLRFIQYQFGTKWFAWISMRYMLDGLISPSVSWNVFRKVRQEKSIAEQTKMSYSHWKEINLNDEKYKISIIIPTIERYSYLVTVLTQLKKQSILPLEVIVIDQSAKVLRNPELFKGYDDIGLQYFEMEKTGQCRSRNLGLMQCKGDYILFIDDDVEVKPDLLENHIKCLKYFNADVSCGVCDEVDAGPIPKEYTFIRHSDVFPTNNGMVKRSVLEKTGLFDMAFDHGQRADGDLGARIYKSGARMILNPEIRVLHHRAPRGGLRKHNVRKMTYSSSRKYITHFRIPHVTEMYLNKMHFSKREQREYLIQTLLGLFSIRGSMSRKLMKIVYAFIMFPSILYKIRRRNRIANIMLRSFPQIPHLEGLKG